MAPHSTDESLVLRSGVRPRKMQAVSGVTIVDDNVWQWIHDVAAASPVQPTVNLGTGFIEYNPPPFLIEAHETALKSVESNQYAPVAGSSELKKTISELFSPLYGRQLNPNTELCITSGAQEGLLSCVMSFVQPGDEVILLEPVFTMYVYQVKMAGGTIRYVPLRPPQGNSTEIISGNDWILDIEELERAITPRTKMMYLNNPHNPLGKVFSKNELLQIGNLCVAHSLVLLSDEVYERVVFPGTSESPEMVPHTRVASLSSEIASHTLTTVSLGKLFNATGWRLGFVIGCEELIRPVIATHLVLAYSSSSPAQDACVIGLREAEHRDWWSSNARDVASRVTRLCSVLDEVGLTYIRPASAWFIFVNIANVKLPEGYQYPSLVAGHNTKDWKVCYFLVQEFGISSIPGTCFYSPDNKVLGESYLRLGACKSDEGLGLASERFYQLKPFVIDSRMARQDL